MLLQTRLIPGARVEENKSDKWLQKYVNMKIMKYIYSNKYN